MLHAHDAGSLRCAICVSPVREPAGVGRLAAGQRVAEHEEEVGLFGGYRLSRSGRYRSAKTEQA